MLDTYIKGVREDVAMLKAADFDQQIGAIREEFKSEIKRLEVLQNGLRTKFDEEVEQVATDMNTTLEETSQSIAEEMDRLAQVWEAFWGSTAEVPFCGGKFASDQPVTMHRRTLTCAPGRAFAHREHREHGAGCGVHQEHNTTSVLGMTLALRAVGWTEGAQHSQKHWYLHLVSKQL